MFSQVVEILKAKGIDYTQLKPALVPSMERREAAFMFDTSQIPDSWYGQCVFERVVPLLKGRSTHSILAGDFIGTGVDQCELRDDLMQQLHEGNPFRYEHSAQFFVVYANNLSPAMMASWHNALTAYRPYVGFLDTTFTSLPKLMFSFMLPTAFLFHPGYAIVAHEDDRSNDEDINPALHPVGCENIVTLPGRTRESRHQADRDTRHQSRYALASPACVLALAV